MTVMWVFIYLITCILMQTCHNIKIIEFRKHWSRWADLYPYLYMSFYVVLNKWINFVTCSTPTSRAIAFSCAFFFHSLFFVTLTRLCLIIMAKYEMLYHNNYLGFYQRFVVHSPGNCLSNPATNKLIVGIQSFVAFQILSCVGTWCEH